ncbi:DUF4236 domain-containing protein [Paraburkholderia madseniana]|uniref:DUF4236 domain-containing protein n=1 Tax=Paraburkholderia madseniana TaxID=2599607 RepID=UPI0038B6EEE7
MGLSYRKSISAGPFRFNLSGGGIGISVGVPGFRVGTGPRGNYVSISQGGFTYRATLPSSGSSQLNHRNAAPTYHRPSAAAPKASNTVGPMVSLSSATAQQLASSSPDSLIQEINKKPGMMAIWPWLTAFAALAVLLAITQSEGGLVMSVATGIPALALCALAAWTYFWDTARRSTVLFYDMDPPAEAAYSAVADRLVQLANSGGKWRIDATGRVLDRKYHAGASNLVKRKPLALGIGPFKHVKCNLEVPYVDAGSNTLYFCPDRLFVVTGRNVAAVGYSELSMHVATTQFIEEDTVPHDATVIGHTWQYVNKSGGPDRRFKNNRQLPIVRYDQLEVRSASGIAEVFQFSSPGVTATFQQAVSTLASFKPLPTP